MKKINTFMEDAVTDLRAGDQSWRVKTLLALYGLGGAVANVAVVQALV